MNRRARALAFLATTGIALALLSVWTLRTLAPAPRPGVASPSPARALPQGDVLVGALPEPKHLNPFTNVDAAVRTWVLRFTHDTLSDLEPQTGQLRPALAEAITPESDGTLHIRLRRDVRFSDGTILTADDVAFTHRCARASGLPMTAMVRAAGMVAALRVVAPDTLVAEGVSTHWSAVAVFATGWPVLSRAAVLARVAARAAAKGQTTPAAEGPAFVALLGELADAGPGTGPYALAPAPQGSLWTRGQRLDLVTHPACWRRAAAPHSWNLAGLRHLFVQETAAQVSLLRQERLDWMAGDVRSLVGADAALAANYRLVVYDAHALGHFMVAWNCRAGPLADARVRTALGMLFDRDAIATRLLAGDAVPAATWFKPGRPEVPADLAPQPFAPLAARALLREAGYGQGRPLRIEILGAAAEPLHRRMLDLAQPAFAAAEVELVPQLLEGSVLLERLQQRAFMGLLAVKYHADPWIDPWPHFHSSQTDSLGLNWMGIADPELDRLLDAARTERDAARRAESYRAFCRRVHELQPVAFLVHPRTAVLLHRRFRDVEVGPGGLSPERWWVPVAEQRAR